jgi:hypothetical protein
MALYSEAVTATGIGATADTFENVGTVTMRDDATKVLGVWIVAATATTTAAEAIHGQVRITMQGVGSQIYTAPPYLGGGPGTNHSYTGVLPEFIPFVHGPPEVDGGEDVVIDYTTHLQDPTVGNDVVACVVYEAGQGVQSATPSADVMAKWPEMAMVAAGGDAEALGQVLTVAESTIADLIVPNWASEIVGFKQEVQPDLMTDGEQVIGFVRYRSSIADYEPQEWPLNAYNAPLGTPVGAGGFLPAIPAMAAFLKAPSARATITPNVVLVTAITTGHSVSAGVYFR